jgi:hypothetical protein
MARHFRHPDAGAHEPGCQETESGEPSGDPNWAYIDVFCSCHHYTEPKILTNGTDIAWPAGWSQEQADTWRKEHDLAPPVGDKVAIGQALPQAGSQGDPDRVNPLPTTETGMLPDPSNPRQNDTAPTG